VSSIRSAPSCATRWNWPACTVAPAHRRRGVGRALLHAAIAQARATRGVRQLKLGVNASNAAALALYRAAGFETYGVEPAALAIDGLFHDEALCMLRLRDS
jgi:ribosomal protein S18 acetylase RimI-like enzyme